MLQFVRDFHTLHNNKKKLYIRAENWWHVSTKKTPNVGISEPIIAGLGTTQPYEVG